jgi:hypothetical protein
MFDSWGSSWGAVSAWGQAWVHTTPPTPVVVIDTHDDVKRINEYKRRREELREDILRAYEDVTGERETEIPVIEAKTIEFQKAKPTFALKRVRDDVSELREVNESILRVSKALQDREINELQDIAFIVSVL